MGNSLSNAERSYNPGVDTGIHETIVHQIPDLPSYTPVGDPKFTWSNLSGEEFCEQIHNCYDEMMTWRRNVFKIPSGRQGQSFVSELARL